MTMPNMPGLPEVISKTMFFQIENLWYWETKAINNETLASSQEGVTSLREAMRSFFENQNIDYQPLGQWPSNFGPLKILPENKFQINKYLTQGN